MKRCLVILVGFLLIGCREKPSPTPKDKPVEKPTASDSMGAAAVDVLTQRKAVEAGLKAKAQALEAKAKENKDLEEAMQE